MAYLTKIKLNGTYYDIRDAEAYSAINILNGDDQTAGSVAKQIKDAISDIKGTSFQVVDQVPDVSVAEDGVIYLVPKTEGTGYSEWIKAKNQSGEYFMEEIGDTDIDLSDYETRDDATAMAKAIIVANEFEITEDASPVEGYIYITIHKDGTADEGIGTDPDDVVYRRKSLANQDELVELQHRVDTLEETVGHSGTESTAATGVFKYIDDLVSAEQHRADTELAKAVRDLNAQTGTATKCDIEMDSESEGTIIMNDMVTLIPESAVIEPDTSWYKPGKTSYTMSTPAEIKGLAKLVNEATDDFHGITITLEDDIDFGNQEIEPIGTMITYTPGKSIYNQTVEDMGGTVFTGTFDGAGHTISNFRITKDPGSANAPVTETGVGLFGIARNGSVIKNINLHNVTIEATDSHMVGALVGYVPKENTAGTGTLEISNCHITGLIKISGDYNVGGLIGRTEAGYSDAYIHDCSVEGSAGSFIQSTITGNVFCGVGGLAGCIYGTVTDNRIINNKVSGVVVYAAAEGVGGLVGHFERGIFEGNEINNVKLVNEFDTSLSMIEAVAVGVLAGNFDSQFKVGSTTSNVTVNENSFENITVSIPKTFNGTTIPIEVDENGYPNWTTWPVLGCFRNVEKINPSTYIHGTADYAVLKENITLERNQK